MTINLNYAPKSNEELYSATNSFYSAIQKLLEREFYKEDKIVGTNKWNKGSDFVPAFIKAPNSSHEEIGTEDILKILATVAIEVSSKGLLHSHVILDIAHRSKVHVDVNFIKTNFCYYLADSGFEKYNTDGNNIAQYNVYVHVRHVPLSGEEEIRKNLLRYTTKTDDHVNVTKDLNGYYQYFRHAEQGNYYRNRYFEGSPETSEDEEIRF